MKSSYNLLKQLQQHHVNIIVERNGELSNQISSTSADADFDKEIDLAAINKIANSIGTDHVLANEGHYFLLKPIAPKMRTDFALSPEKQAWLNGELQEQKKEVEKIEDPEKRAHALAMLHKQDKQLLLGLPDQQDRKVNYNPGPLAPIRKCFQRNLAHLDSFSDRLAQSKMDQRTHRHHPSRARHFHG